MAVDKGTPQEWVDIIRSCAIAEEIISQWLNFNNAAWTWEERKPVNAAYLNHLAKVSGKEHRRDMKENKAVLDAAYMTKVKEAAEWLDSRGKVKRA